MGFFDAGGKAFGTFFLFGFFLFSFFFCNYFFASYKKGVVYFYCEKWWHVQDAIIQVDAVFRALRKDWSKADCAQNGILGRRVDDAIF